MHRFLPPSARFTRVATRQQNVRVLFMVHRNISSLLSPPTAANRHQQQPSWTRQHHNYYRAFSTTPDNNSISSLPVKILYGSQGGTAQIFAMQLVEALEEVTEGDVSVEGLHETPPDALCNEKEAALHVFLTATAGVGEPTDNARQFYDWLMAQDDGKVLKGLPYTVFGLGNSVAHPNHYNVVGKTVDEKLHTLGATRAYPLGLGDDGDCIEDDYDTWMEGFLQTVYRNQDSGESTSEDASSAKEEEEATIPASTVAVKDPDTSTVACAGAKDKKGSRLISTKYAQLNLAAPETDFVRDDMMHLGTQNPGAAFYGKNTHALSVLSNRPLNPQAGENGLYEMRVSLENTGGKMSYETGDHLMVYPQNSEALVEGFLQRFDVDPHAILNLPETPGRQPYPHPTGITLKETLRHCVDLSGVPSPAVARHILGKPKIDYKNDIATPHRTVLDLMAEANRPFALEEIVYNLPQMKARYYSIASSSLVHPNEIYLVYRPVQYASTRGNLHSGVCTSYLINMMGREDAALDDYNTVENSCSQLIASVNSNPTFRLPSDEKTPVLFIAGGCGVAPIRAFLEERIHIACEHSHNPYGEGYLFLGFRSPGDAPYKALVEQAFQCGAISNIHLTYSSGCGKGADSKIFGEGDLQTHTSCGLVSDAVGEHGEQLYSFFERGGHTYICGGARLFGVAIENQVHLLMQNHGGLSENEATEYLRRLLEDGR